MERSADWLDQARWDLDHARHALSGEFFDWACFSAQQAAEKGVKAALQRLGAEAWGHSVADLLTELTKTHPTASEFGDIALELDKVYIPSRYPDAHPTGSPRRRYTRTEAERLLDYADQIIRFCASLLPSP